MALTHQREDELAMSGILLDRPAPGATTCIVIGDVRETGPLNLARFRSILWWLDPATLVPSVSPIPSDRVQFARVGTDDIPTTLERFVRLNPRSLPSLLISNSVGSVNGQAYERLITATHRLLEDTHRIRVTRQQDGFAWQKHVLQNAPAYARHRLPDSWAGALSGLPAFICGAGPSLDVSMGKLAAASDRAVIFSADSALRALARHGVQADFAVSTDVAKVPDKCLPSDFSPIRVVLASISPPAWLGAVPEERRYFLSGHQLTDDWFAQQGVARTTIAVAESCGSTAIELAHHLGCDPIHLFGLDLAVDPANQARRHHQDANAALYVDSNYDPTAQLPRVPGNYSDTVPCFALDDWQELDARLASRTAPRVFNVTDRGARLRGTTLIHPDQFTLDAPIGVKHARLAGLSSESSSNDPAIARALNRLSAVGEECHRALPELKRALERKGPAALAEAFRPLLVDPSSGRALGAFALKLMPHLVPPIEGDRAFWETLLSEFEELATLARTARP